MSIYQKSDKNSPKLEPIAFKGKSYYPDYIIRLPLDKNSKINIDNCDCVFLIADANKPDFRKYVGARHFRKSKENEKIPETINGYNPQYIFCFTETPFPINAFIKEQDFKSYQAF
jgi:hypothetical protein